MAPFLRRWAALRRKPLERCADLRVGAEKPPSNLLGGFICEWCSFVRFVDIGLVVDVSEL
jgi:hypothetical protein